MKKSRAQIIKEQSSRFANLLDHAVHDFIATDDNPSSDELRRVADRFKRADEALLALLAFLAREVEAPLADIQNLDAFEDALRAQANRIDEEADPEPVERLSARELGLSSRRWP
ncbi:hypothetical protein [Chelatococcus asaccharovorans]|uniref:Uncharacterized protein n=1 Tax=Chelatococcus asaccharovorans TaxID=28210 RepID=A0A2V3UNB0_9HYPH|nr:hypothetical protein [Chelatococcus asaccharovorans]MBS7703287.1 hypothetical protein [Chelatococcus asaccharovorans]PXW61620.1 hypothetical protein C7450_103137 [Chelatococcus asaccharovorans]